MPDDFLQWLRERQLWTRDIAVAKLKLVFTEGRRLSSDLRLHAFLEDAHVLGGVQIVESDPCIAPDDDELSNLVRVGPADVNVSDHVVRVTERDEADVLANAPENAPADSADPLRFCVEQEVEDRHVVRRQIPDRVYVRANRAEIGPASVEVVDGTESVRTHQRLDLPNA